MTRRAERLFCPSIVATLLITLIAGCGRGDDKTVGGPLEPPAAPQKSQRGGSKDHPPYEAIELSSVGAVRGTVRLRGDPPELSPIPVSKDQEVCGLEIPDISLQLGPGSAVEDAVVSLVGVSKGKAVGPLGRLAELELVKCNALPRIQIVPVGTSLEIYNSDPLLHDIYASVAPAEEVFHIALPFQHYRARVELDRPGLVHVRCGAGHPWMSAYVVVQENPYVALTSARGAYVIGDIPPGSYRLRVWHERLGQKESPLIVAAGTTVTVDLELEYATATR